VWADRPELAEALSWAEASGLLEPADMAGEARIRLTLKGRLLSNELFARLV
jgi:hypothetical protein